MQDAVAEFLRAPLWAQIAMVAFALGLVVSVTGSFFAKRRFRGRFMAIAQTLGARVPNGSGWPATFPVTIDGRAFEIRHALVSTGRNSSYRGPHGHLLTTATRLYGERWPLHQVDISLMGKLISRITGGTPSTGDPGFDARFRLREDGLKVRAGWLDAAVRDEVTRVFDGIPSDSLIAIQEGELLITLREPWKGIDGTAVRALLGRQVALAAALQRTASGRH
ncbi:MAG: hypothetical protein ABIQ52_08650 [Vicinamibacterales bacterium]